MKKLLFVFSLFLSFYASAQWNPTGSRTRFVPGIGIGTRDTSWYTSASDTSIIVMGKDSVLYYKYKGFFKPMGSGSGGGGSTLTLGSGLTGGSYNGSAAVTAKVDTTLISTKANVNALLTGYAPGASVVKYTDTATMLSSYYNKTATDSRLALKLNISDTAAMLGNYYNKTATDSRLLLKLDKSDSTIASRVTADRVFVNASLPLKLNISDTAAMLGNYYNKTATDSRLALKLNISDTASMLSTHPNLTYVTSNLATKQNNLTLTTTGTSGAATLVGATLNIPQYAGGGGGGTVTSVAINNASGLTGTSPITSTGTIGADTAILSTKANVTASLIGYAANALVVKYTDTTSMLSTHPNKTYVDANVATKLNISDTALLGGTNYYNKVTVDGKLGLKVNYTDTSTMLGNYVRTPNYGITKTGQAFGVDTAAMSTKANVVALLTGYTAGALVVKYTDTASMLSTHPNKTYVDANVATKQNTVTLTTTGTSGAATFNSSTGALNIPNYATGGGGTTTNALTLGNGLNTGSFNGSAAVTATVDTLLMTTKNWHKKGIDSLANVASVANALKVNISDTATMLSAYYNKTATDSRLALKVNYTDTSTMLGNYIRTANYGTVKTGQALGVDTTLISTRARLTASLIGYAADALVVKYTDTASMLSTHPNLTYVTSNLATKQNNLTLTTTGTSGAATLVGATLNIPNYASGGGGTTTNALTLGSGLTGGSFNGSVAVTATVDTAAFKIATKTDIKDDYTSITQSADSTYFLITSKSGLQVDTVRLRYTTLTGGGGTPSDMSLLQITRSTTYANTASYVDLTFDVNNLVNNTTDINHSTSTNTNRITIGTTGVYAISINGTIAPTVGGTNNTDIELQLFKNGTTVIPNSYVYAENSSADLEQFSRTMYVSLTAGDYFTVQSKYLLAASTLQNAQVAVAKMSGTTGATGATGAASFTNTQGITAAGTNQSTATLLTTKINDVTTTASGTGVRLPPATVSDYITVINHGANPLNVYPATGETVEGGATNAPFVLLEGQSYEAGVSTAGAWVGINVNVYDDENTSINIATHASTPPAPISGSRIFAKNIGGRSMAAQTGPSGVDYPFQPHTGRNKVVQWQPIGNATTVPIADGILAPTNLTTVTARNVATTNILTRMKRLGFVSAATTGSVTGSYFLAGAQQYTIGDGAGLGGFHYIERFGVSDAATVSGARAFIGWRSVVTAPTNVDPSTQTNQFGLAQLSTDATQWYIVYGGSAAQTAIALGTALGAPTLTNTAWDVSFFAPPNSNNTVKYTVTNLGSGVSVSGTLTGTAGTALPSSTTLLAPCTWRTNNATALAVGIDISSIYIETDQ